MLQLLLEQTETDSQLNVQTEQQHIDSQEINKLLTAKEAAEILNTNVQRVWELVRRKIIPVIHIGNRIRIDKAKLLDWIRQGGTDLDEYNKSER